MHDCKVQLVKSFKVGRVLGYLQAKDIFIQVLYQIFNLLRNKQ